VIAQEPVVVDAPVPIVPEDLNALFSEPSDVSRYGLHVVKTLLKLTAAPLKSNAPAAAWVQPSIGSGRRFLDSSEVLTLSVKDELRMMCEF
jgi:hypothetical protein